MTSAHKLIYSQKTIKKFMNERELEPNSTLYIMKPIASSRGRGIKVYSNQMHIPKKSSHLVSKYIANPHIFNEYKYDLRIYVLITSFDPLKVYMHKYGIVRFATIKYATDPHYCSKRYMHLTNFALNKKNSKFVYNEEADDDGVGNKWSMSAYKKKLKELGIDTKALFAKVKDVIIKAIIAIEPQSYTSLKRGRNNCFELYGFDILIDKDLKPWLMEVNVSPSLNSSAPLDKKLKTTVISDTLHLIGVVPYDRKKYEKQMESEKLARFTGLSVNGQTISKAIARNKNTRDIVELQNALELSEVDVSTLIECDEEFNRKGLYKRIFPRKENIDSYMKYFEALRYNNLLLWKWLKSGYNFLSDVVGKQK